MPMLNLKLKYFASVREAVGVAGEQATSNASTVGALRDELIARGGAYAQSLARDQAIRVALNQTMCEESASLSEDDEAAFFPPVTGG